MPSCTGCMAEGSRSSSKMSHSVSSSETNSSLKASTANTVAEVTNGGGGGGGCGTVSDTVSSQFTISLVQESTALKKGLLWEQQKNCFFFNRWKERFFILTTDYLTCFKKGSKKVGMSEMGSFVYKINLNEIKALSWVDKKKHGVIGVQLANTALFLWIESEKLLDEWMISLQESTKRTKCRREALRKSATLLPTLLTSSPSHLISKNFDLLIERTNSPNLFLPRSCTPSESNLMLDNLVPPPPPPRRYLRCLSTDLETMPTLADEDKLNCSTQIKVNENRIREKHPSGTSTTTTMQAHNSSNTFHKPGHDSLLTTPKLSDSNSQCSMTQSLRCKSSYAIHLSPLMLTNNSPTLIQQQQRRATAKRLSTLSQGRPHSQTVFHCDSLQSADSEFSFISSKSISIKSNLDSYRNGVYNNNTATSRGSYQQPPQAATTRGSRHPLTSSASLVLNARRKLCAEEQKTMETPPPVPPHRTHLHHF